jgi:RNA polymerase sigma-70 factor (ECF subfamily)
LENELQIIKNAASGQVSAFEALVQFYKPHVFKIVANMVATQDVEEVAQEAFIRVYKDLPSFKAKSPFQHWLSKVTVRTCYDYWRKERKRKIVPVPELELQNLARELSGLDQMEHQAVERAKEILDWALGHLNPQDRLAFSLLYLEERSMKDVGQILGWSLAQVKMRSFRARHVLRKLLVEKLEK